MKKMIKMSLVAAVAVAGLNTTSSAANLEDSIKNTDLSGYIRYRYTNGADEEESNKYKTVFKINSKVNDNVNAFIKIEGEDPTTNSSGDADPDQTAIKEAKFIIKAAGATVIAGKQGLQTPFADISDQQGTGLVALYPVGPVTLAAGWYTNSDATAKKLRGTNTTTHDLNSTAADLGGNNISAIAAIGKAGTIDYSLWAASVSENDLGINNKALAGAGIEAGATAYNANVKGAFGPVSVEGNWAYVQYSSNNADVEDDLGEPMQARVVASLKAGPATITGGVVVTGEDGGDVTLGDTDATANFILENLSASDTSDDTVLYLGVKAPVGPITLGLEHAAADDADVRETKLSASYKMSKNFKVSTFATNTNFDEDMTRLEMKYTF